MQIWIHSIQIQSMAAAAVAAAAACEATEAGANAHFDGRPFWFGLKCKMFQIFPGQYPCKASKAPRLHAWLASEAHDVVSHLAKLSGQEKLKPIKQIADVFSTCAWGMSMYYHVCRTSGRVFSQSQLKSVTEGGYAFLHSYSWLAKEFQTKSIRLFKIVPKMHAMHHILIEIEATSNNPYFWHCFADEDMVGTLIKISSKVHPATATERTLERYRILLSIQWRKAKAKLWYASMWKAQHWQQRSNNSQAAAWKLRCGGAI